jgi:hypothetical protein
MSSAVRERYLDLPTSVQVASTLQSRRRLRAACWRRSTHAASPAAEPICGLLCMVAFLIHRVIDAGGGVLIQLRVPVTTALEWHPELRGNERLLRAAADRRAVREASELRRERELAPGRWRATWCDSEVVFELLQPRPHTV